jgi:hypothetical protein
MMLSRPCQRAMGLRHASLAGPAGAEKRAAPRLKSTNGTTTFGWAGEQASLTDQHCACPFPGTSSPTTQHTVQSGQPPPLAVHGRSARPPSTAPFPVQQQLDFWVLMALPSPGLMVLAGLLIAGSRAILQKGGRVPPSESLARSICHSVIRAQNGTVHCCKAGLSGVTASCRCK